MKFKIETLGCRTNQYESQALMEQLVVFGHVLVSDNADICIVNACSVTHSADSTSRHKIRQLMRQNPNAKIVVTGCIDPQTLDLLQREINDLVFVPNKDKDKLLSKILDEQNFPEFAIKNFSSNTRAFVKVQDGCNSFCSYCIIPYMRGRSCSRSIDDILREVNNLVKNGYKEIVLTGINVGDFSFDGKKLADLVKIIDQIEGLERIRLSSIGPLDVNEQLIDAIINCEKTCPSLHLSLQSGSNEVLHNMNRKYTREQFLERVYFLREANHDFTFTTDIIVGFPGETDENFAETMDLVKRAKFLKIHVFPYSKREGTRSARMKNVVPQKVINDRKQKLLELSEQVSYDVRNIFIGRNMMVLTEGDGSFGHTSNFLKVQLNKSMSKNSLVKVQLINNSQDCLTCISHKFG